MTHNVGKEGVAWKPLVNLDLDRTYLVGLDAAIEDCHSPQWDLGCCLMGLSAPCNRYPLTRDEYALQAWLLYAKLFPDAAERILDIVEKETGVKREVKVQGKIPVPAGMDFLDVATR